MSIESAPPTFPVRDKVQRLGMLTAARNLRSVARREVSRWVQSGCPSPAPNVVKFNVVKSYVIGKKTPVFIETGTYLGSMVEYISNTGVECHSIEIDKGTYDRTRKILAGRPNINLILGDSGVELPKLLAALDRPATFWLDGHYSGGFTGRAEIDTPVSQELDAILAHPVKQHVILIDDARDFTGADGYPKLSDVLAVFDDHPDYRAWVSADIIRIEPR